MLLSIFVSFSLYFNELLTQKVCFFVILYILTLFVKMSIFNHKIWLLIKYNLKFWTTNASTSNSLKKKEQLLPIHFYQTC